MPYFEIRGNFNSSDALCTYFAEKYPGRRILLATEIESESNISIDSEMIIIKAVPEAAVSENVRLVDEISRLSDLLQKKDIELKDAENTASKALLSIQSFHKQQQALFDEFVVLRQKYDEQKMNLQNILWSHCSLHHPELRHIPPLESDEFLETEFKIGSYVIGNLLGEGQFASVRACYREVDKNLELALKIIKKERIATFSALRRMSNEILTLRKLKSEYIVCIHDVFQTASKLYIVTEKGGADLFEFFDEHPDGVPEFWARQIMSRVLNAVLYCHNLNYCHRDLKPENILVTFDPVSQKCIDLKLCDFGLAAKYSSKAPLTDFCGSPGFFAPEMITAGSYYGDKVDVWSTGCILLELVLGHERFCNAWMAAYDYQILQDKEQFQSSVNTAVERLPKVLDYSESLNNFVLKFLDLNHSSRTTIKMACSHPWIMEDNEGLLSVINGAFKLISFIYDLIHRRIN